MDLRHNLNEKIRYQSLTKEYLPSALECMKNSFYKYENVCNAVGLPHHPEAISELEELTLRTANDGLSVIAIDTKENIVCGVSFNKVQVKNNEAEGTYFENFAKNCKYSSSRGVVQYMKDADSICDLFEYCNVDCILEIMFLATLPEYTSKGIATKLCELSIDLVKKLKQEINVKQSMDGQEIPLEPIPKIAAALFTSNISQRVGRKLNFQIAATDSYDKYFYKGVAFSNVIGPTTPYFTLEFKVIE
ncbi:unnamed protein product [Brassicogethes aeneus]|uniref:N-acetyltransferase domain-containing protein n=1 Tax=Brassicogethes aeneus TaxID=1431903 RepID=A0A9P0ASB7_BRAAE|nr:unnamed protein product [Brassicogethes aeneus]